MANQLQQLPSQSKMFNYDEGNKMDQKTQKQQKMASFLELFRFADKTDKILMFFGTIGAALIGTAMPIFALLWGDMTTAFGQGDDAIVDASRTIMFQFFGIGGGAFFAAWMMYACWMIAGERQAIKCRKEYLKSLLGQEIGWFDQVNQSQISSKFSADCFSFQGAIGEKVSLMIQTFAMFIAGFVIAFIKGWRMTLVTLAAIPALAIAGAIYVTAIQTKDKRNAKFYAKAGGLAEQAFSSIKTVKQLNGQKFQIAQYKKCLQEGSKKGLKFGFFAALALGIMSFSMLAAHALGFWYGSNCVEGNSHCPGDYYEPGDVLIVFFSVLMAALNLSQLSPSIKKIAEGKSAAARIFEVLDREPLVKNPQNPKTPSNFVGHIKFEDVTFAYPKNKKANILNNISLEFNAHNTALVGQSGCGKSTILQLLMRFYDPDQGAIYLDGINLKELDLGWLRSKIGYVGQQPVLFAMSIKQNLLFGKQNATDQEINEALRQAQALDFVKTLDDGINTFVGSGGGQLSGGQKQRIAIARALLRNPQILLLDEATSALDRKNEKLIQKTLDRISKSRTTISIAHRTKTIMSADIIYVLNKGVIEQKGKFRQLKRYKDYVVQQEKQVQQVHHKKQQHSKTGRIDFVIQTGNENTTKNDAQAKNKQQVADQENKKLLNKYKQGIYTRLFRYSQGSRCLLIVGLFFSIATGLIYPAFTIFFAQMLKTLFDFKLNPTQARQDANFYALIFTIIAIIGCFVNFFNSSIFSVVGDKITRRVRLQAFSKIVKMPIPWFDLPKNNGGQLTTKLASDSLMVNGLTATFVSILLQNAATLIAGLIVAFIFEWRTALFSVSMLPLMIIVGMISQNRKSGFSDKTDEIYKQSSNLIVQCMTNIRTVQSFGYEDIVLRKYEKKLEEPMNIGIKKGNVSGILFAISQLIMFFVFGLIFFLGTVFKRDNGLGMENVFTAIYAIFFSAMTIGNNSHFLPDIEEGKLAAARLFQVIDGEDEDQMQIREQSKLLKTPIEGKIVIEDLSFKYETRNTHVFQGFNHKIEKGHKIAFVGASGCGKSTILQLIQRFYFPEKGQIFIDGINIKDYDIHHLRASLGVVSQQPTLFNGSFKFNIQYNIPNVSMEQIVQVSRSANAFSFIMGEEKLEQIKSQKIQNKNREGEQEDKVQTEDSNRTGFDRSVGLKGSQISGGQKQRVAIARTLLRRPKVLLLDEATSALDSKNQEIVQKALDRIMEGRTTISVAHRIDTIKNSDQIDVFQRGRIVESGKYEQLVKRKGYFYNLERGTEFL